MDSKFEYKVKRHIPICDYERLWIKLTIGGGIALFIIVKGCTAPILFNNKLLVWLFCSDVDGDKTLYNVAISYVAAYIFYLFQIYFPERNKTKRVLEITALDAYNFVNQVRRFIFVWDNMAETTNDGVITRIKNYHFYYKGTVYSNIAEANIDELRLTSERIIEDYNKIIHSSEFQFADLTIYKLFREYDFEKEIVKFIMLLKGADTASETSATIFETYSRPEIDSIISRMNILIWIYGFSGIDSYEIVNDEKAISDWKEEQQKIYDYWSKNKKFFENLPQGYQESMK